MLPMKEQGRQSFSHNLHSWRKAAADIWESEINANARNPRRIPSYFIDRYAYRIYEANLHGRQPHLNFHIFREGTTEAWHTLLRQTLVGVPALSLPPPDPTDTIPSNGLLSSMLATWRRYLQAKEILVPHAAFGDPSGMTWAEFFSRSPYYPRRPAIAGPTFFERLHLSEQRELLARVAPADVMALYVFLVQVHEEMHTLQTGEPLLGEINLACLWSDFLDTHDLWWWQRSVALGTCFNVEHPWISTTEMRMYLERQMALDTFDGIRNKYPKAPGLAEAEYDRLCYLGSRFDRGELKYARYLELATQVLGVAD